MPAVYLRSPLELEEISHLKKEFPYYRFFTNEHFKDSLDPDQLWKEVEVIYTDHLNHDELSKAESLRWIHLPCQDVNHLCLDQIALRENILVTVTKQLHAIHVAEWTIASYLAFAKNLYYWKGHQDAESHTQYKNSTWQNKDKVWLQVGLFDEGTEIARQAKQLGLEVWGVNKKGSFNPHCHKVYDPTQIHSLLPATDVLCINCREHQGEHRKFTREELLKLKEGAIILLFCGKEAVDGEDLYHLLQKGRLRGVAVDTTDHAIVHTLHPLKEDPRVIVTPLVATYPLEKDTQALRLFKHNLRQYIHNNLQDMESKVGTSQC